MTKDDTPAKTFKIQIDKTMHEWPQPIITGRDLLNLAKKQPVEQFAVYQKVPGAQPQRIQLDDKVDLREPGREKFLTLPLDQTEGLGMRRQFALPAEDMEWLAATGLDYELVVDGGVPRVVIHGFPVPAGYTVDRVAVNVRIEPGYPEAQIDMAYFLPALQRRDGRAIPATCGDTFDGKTWQRWSRHRTGANPWRPGIDNLSTHMALVGDWLTRELKRA